MTYNIRLPYTEYQKIEATGEVYASVTAESEEAALALFKLHYDAGWLMNDKIELDTYSVNDEIIDSSGMKYDWANIEVEEE